MQRKSRLFIANIVLGVVLAVILCISIAVMTMFYGVFREVKQEYEAYSWGYIYDELSEDNSSWDYEYEWDSDTDWDYESSWDYETVYYSLPSITGASAELIGPEYREEAFEGYQYYQVTMQVYNAGTEYLPADFLDLSVEGEAYDDVYLYHEPYPETASEFDYVNQRMIPSCQTATISFVMEVKEGVEDVTLEIFQGYGKEADATYVLNLN